MTQQRRLILMRHGHAKDIDPALGAIDGDRLRELRDKGKRNAQRQGIWLAQHNIRPEIVYASPAIRARRTAEKCIKSSGLPANCITISDSLYPGHANAVRDLIRHIPDTINTAMIVAHNPGLEAVAAQLSATPLPRNKKDHALPPASLAILSFEGDWSQQGDHQAVLDHVIWPKDLPRLFPWPGSDGEEGRIRPAYYYHQSSVIPWRRQNGLLEVLVIASSKNRHMVVPKGIHDPGMSPQASAAKEAREEAGITGIVADTALGSYVYDKWDATCDVQVFAMEVTGYLPDSDWPESHRGRQWLPVNAAADQVANPEVAALIRHLPIFLDGKG